MMVNTVAGADNGSKTYRSEADSNEKAQGGRLQSNKRPSDKAGPIGWKPVQCRAKNFLHRLLHHSGRHEGDRRVRHISNGK